jgi:hypothetical protein
MALNIVIETNTYGRETHLSLKPGDQARVHRPWSFLDADCGQGPKHPRWLCMYRGAYVKFCFDKQRYWI